MTEKYSVILLCDLIVDAGEGGGAGGRDCSVSFELINFKKARYMQSKNLFIVNGLLQIKIMNEVRNRRGLKERHPTCSRRALRMVGRRVAQEPSNVVQWR